jgi:hypothetical protein
VKGFNASLSVGWIKWILKIQTFVQMGKNNLRPKRLPQRSISLFMGNLSTPIKMSLADECETPLIPWVPQGSQDL